MRLIEDAGGDSARATRLKRNAELSRIHFAARNTGQPSPTAVTDLFCRATQSIQTILNRFLVLQTNMAAEEAGQIRYARLDFDL